MHTPGPWRLDRYIDSGRDNPGRIFADNPHGEGPQEIASVDWIGGGFHAEQVANARLIAAAPALLDALVNLMAAYRDSINGPEVDAARKAVSLARGN